MDFYSEREKYLYEEKVNFFYDFLVKNIVPYFDSDEILDTEMKLMAEAAALDYMSDSLLHTMGNPEACPDYYLEGLLSMIGYPYDNTISPDYHREAYKYFLPWQKIRGTEISLLKASSYAAVKGWVTGEYFLPDYKNPGITSSITYPYKRIFEWDHSKWSSSHKYFDGTFYSKGVIQIAVDYLSDRVIEETLKVLPAGLKVYFVTSRVLVENNKYSTIDFTHSVIYSDITHISYLYALIETNVSNTKIWSKLNSAIYWSGKLKTEEILVEEISRLYASFRFLDEVEGSYLNLKTLSFIKSSDFVGSYSIEPSIDSLFDNDYYITLFRTSGYVRFKLVSVNQNEWFRVLFKIKSGVPGLKAIIRITSPLEDDIIYEVHYPYINNEMIVDYTSPRLNSSSTIWIELYGAPTIPTYFEKFKLYIYNLENIADSSISVERYAGKRIYSAISGWSSRNAWSGYSTDAILADVQEE